jgi:hypothetical protein
MTTPRAIAPRVAAAAAAPRAEQVRCAVAVVQTRLIRLRQGRALLIAAALAAVVSAVLLAASARVGLAPVVVWGSGALTLLLALAVQAARWRPITLERAALWCEERQPTGYALVTLVERANESAEDAIGERLAAASSVAVDGRGPSARALREATQRAWTGPAVALALALALAGGAGWLAQRATAATPLAAAGARAGRTDTRPEAIVRTGVGAWRVMVRAPRYTGGAERALGDVTSVTALVGSEVLLEGRGTAESLAVRRVGESQSEPLVPVAARAASGDTAWRLAVRVPDRPVALRVARDGDERVLTLLPIPDSLPVVRLLAPLRDTVTRDTAGTLVLSADARDDLGLTSARFELIVTSGSGERYEARTVVLGAQSLAGARTTTLAARVSFAELGLLAGDVVHLRAIARDAHPAADREFGVSETRSLRIARADEYDSVAVDAAPPPPVDSSLLSQRMLLMLTERLEARRPQLARETLVAESRRLAVEQGRIRRAVSAIVFQRLSGDGDAEHVHYEGDGHEHGVVVQDGKLVPSTPSAAVQVMPGATPPPGLSPMLDEGGESPVLGINRPLLEAYNAMWDAGRALELAEPGAAIPPMRLALEAIQRARAADRVYLRGRSRPVVVDLARVRLAGRDTGRSTARPAAAAAPRAAVRLDDRLWRAASLFTTDAAAARDSLLALRLDALTEAPTLAEAVQEALAALARGSDATPALTRARRSVTPVQRADGLSPWSSP